MIGAELCEPLLEWFAAQGRRLPWRRDREPYHVWLSEIMLQQTRIETVIPYYECFIQKFPDVTTLTEVEEERLLKLWQGLGY